MYVYIGFGTHLFNTRGNGGASSMGTCDPITVKCVNGPVGAGNVHHLYGSLHHSQFFTALRDQALDDAVSATAAPAHLLIDHFRFC